MAGTILSTEEGAFLLYDEAFGPEGFPLAWFGEAYWRERNLVVAEVPGRGSVLFVNRDGETWVLRRYRRGGFIARVTEDRYLWMGLERTRAFREWRLLHALHAVGLPVPRPVAARVVRTGVNYRAEIITVCIENARSLASLIAAGEAQQGHWENIGRTLRRFHDEGVDHADLNAHNILLDPGEAVYLVDFDRGGIRAGATWKKRNLSRMLRSLRKISLETGATFDEEGWRRLLLSYESAGRRPDKVPADP